MGDATARSSHRYDSGVLGLNGRSKIFIAIIGFVLAWTWYQQKADHDDLIRMSTELTFMRASLAGQSVECKADIRAARNAHDADTRATDERLNKLEALAWKTLVKPSGP